MACSTVINTIISILLASTIAIASHDEDVTPARPQTALIEPTPGQKLSQEQAGILTREKFIKAFEPTVVDQWQINWEVFQNQSLPFDASQKRVALKKLIDKLNTVNRVTTEQRALYGDAACFKNQMEAVHAQRLDVVALSYFKEIFPRATLSSEMKLDGVQLGERIIVNQGQPNERRYHVKTHTAGRLSSNSTAAKAVNPQELLAYRVLEHLGVGCETHFLERSCEDVYIATLDAGTGGIFSVFASLIGSKHVEPDANLGKRLVGSLMDISHDPYRLDFKGIEANTAHDPIAQNFIQQMAQLDIITRILRLHDLLNNSDNWGFVEFERQHPAVKVIDFRVIDDPKLAIDNENWGSFLEGNGLYQYAGSHKTMRYVIHDRPLSSRVETAQRIFDAGLKENLQNAARLAYRDLLIFIRQPNFPEKQQGDFHATLTKYYQAIQSNIEFFSDKLRDWTPENKKKNEKRDKLDEFGTQQRPRQPLTER